MPIQILAQAVTKGIDSIPYGLPILKATPWLVLIYFLKSFFQGTKTTSERLMHSKVVMITGGTSGIGAAIATALASRGAQLILLTHHAPSDPFLSDYISDLRHSTANSLIYAEQVDLSSLHSIRVFATKWVDNAPPRRLDMIILCADTQNPRFTSASVRKAKTVDKLDPVWMVNYLANFHMLSILSPALRAQPPDRDVRVVVATCASYVGGDLKGLKDARSPLPVGKEYATTKLGMMVFARAFQKHLDAYVRPDKAPNNARVIIVDPGLTRTPGLRRWISMGSLLGLIAYVLLWPLWWLVLKSPDMGAQGFLMATMEADLGRGVGGRFLRECRDREILRPEVNDEGTQEKLWEFSEKMIEAVEKEGAVRRAIEKKEKEERDKRDGVKEGNGKPKKEVKWDESVDKPSGEEARKPGSRRSKKA
ncbi:hypothetical protein MMC25_005910 [Agyrium rufum]|nr:hypothetical protein [Agyrium rufum]